MKKLVHRLAFSFAALLYIIQQYRVHSLSPHQYVQMSGEPASLIFSLLLGVMMLYVLWMTMLCLVHLVKHAGSRKLEWILFILGLPLVGTYVYLEKHLYPNPPSAQVGNTSSSGATIRLGGGLSIAAAVVAAIVACTFFVLLSLRVLFEEGNPLWLTTWWADVYEALLGPGKILFVLGVLLAVVALIKGWPHRVLLKASMVTYGIVFWAYLGIMWWLQFRPSEVLGIAIVEQGVYATASEGGEGSHYVCIEETDSVQARPGTHFGVLYTVLGRPPGGITSATVLWKFPAPGVWDSTRNAFQRSLVERTNVAIGDTSSSIYVFDTPYTLLPGEWSVQVRDELGDWGEARFVVSSPGDSATPSAGKNLSR
jgi:hypothetical protein